MTKSSSRGLQERVGRDGFEPPKAKPADLQSAPVGRLGTDPLNNNIACRIASRERRANFSGMPSFDVVSEVDMQEVKNAVDQASREVGTRFDFKDTGSSIELSDKEIKLESATEDRLKAVRQVLEEKMVKRAVSLKSLDYGNEIDGSKGSKRQVVKLVAGIDSDKAKAINRFIKEAGLKGISSQTQGDQVRVTGKKRDDLQSIIALLKEHDFDIPLQFNNFRD